jgi:hypothetical protein
VTPPQAPLSPCLDLLALLLRGEDEAACSVLVRDPAVTTAFTAFVERYNLRLYLRTKLAGSPLRACLPEAWLESLEAFAQAQIAKQRALVRDLARLAAAFDAAGEELTLLKGPYLATRFYGGIDRRAFVDLDILVRRERLDRVEAVLEASGFERRSSVVISKALTARFTHAFDYGKGATGVDVHWRLDAHPSYAIDDARLWRERGEAEVEGRRYFVLSDEYEVVQALVALLRDLERGAVPLRQLVDLHVILAALGATIDWDRFLESRRDERLLVVAVNLFALLVELLGLPRGCEALLIAIDRHRDLVKSAGRAGGQSLLEPSAGALRNKLWAARLHESSALRSVLWWSCSLPFRFVAHHPGKTARLRRRLAQLARRLAVGHASR